MYNLICRQSITIAKLQMDQKRVNSNIWKKVYEYNCHINEADI